MTTATAPQPPVVALPPKAVTAGGWDPDDNGALFRYFDGEERQVAAGTKYGEDAVVFAHGVQHDDGSIADGTDEFFSPPSISINTIDSDDGHQTETGITLTSEAARRLADVLVTAADEVDGWAAR